MVVRDATCHTRDVYTSTLHAETGIGGYNHIITQSRKHDAWGRWNDEDRRR